ncbi:MAG: imidazole glycerol phosphate synthase subunit HisH [Ruminococcaceae bacterium]|nr:imidazole glycerol phosphate synthase subunit HisH [Oscillospiraceae bacterium]
MTAIIDYGVGNLYSLKSSFAAIGEQAVVTGEENEIRNADRIILPGVGAFSDAMEKLRRTGLDRVLIDEAEKGKPVMGICLGMQMLFDKSYEYGEYDGLSLVRGKVRPIADVSKNLKIPQIGWNSLIFKKTDCPIFKYIKDGDFVYFVHSYYADECTESTVAVTEYGALLTAAVQNKNVFGCQFHPEKSGDTGLKILKAFCEIQE